VPRIREHERRKQSAGGGGGHEGASDERKRISIWRRWAPHWSTARGSEVKRIDHEVGRALDRWKEKTRFDIRAHEAAGRSGLSVGSNRRLDGAAMVRGQCTMFEQ
jgi:hypothetical protein